ncbi:hypothetical protein CAEBREN_01145 [Caenorhabditis brenneri]|uniref:RGS domain-containing protein n=1 Tax=Caenorhabditis brenneri TaxID=135651 RepID=G0NB96_CAEBE|nr:hypothetical protein CAEBREN_01145 [Caenorhabditis brenneri]
MENRSPTVMDIAQMRLENIVRLDWVSTEDGTHMLTVGMGTIIGQDPAQQNVTLMRESETTMRRPSIRKASSLLPNIQPHSRFTSWICCRVLSFTDLNNQKPSCVHWLNNKEIVFSVGAEKLLAEAVMLDLDSSANASGDVLHSSGEYRSDSKNGRPMPNTSGRKGAGSVSSDSPSTKDILDVKLETLLRQWTKSNDVLFSIYPVDGSLLTWTVEWLDDHFRQPAISYSSRLPGALPTSDSMSLKSKLNKFNPHEPIYLDALRNDIENKDTSTMLHDMEQRVSNTIHLLTSHDNGTLNLWHMSVDDQSSFSHVVSVTHISRMCGHRFQMQQIIAHPVLPLLLTTSKFKAPRLKVEPTMDVLSEVILWEFTPVEPLCKNGGVKELARVASSITSGFSSVGWVPAILPSCTLGTVCNSPSSCFIACDGGQLIIYQAVLDARGLLSELSNAKTACNNRDTLDNYSDKILRTPSSRCDRAPSFLKQFNVVSTQSTAKPGCVLEARIVISDDDEASDNNPMSSVIDRSQSPTFEDKFFIVLLDHKENEDIIMMFSLTIFSQTPQSIPNFDTEALSGEKGFLRPSSSLAPSMAKLNFDAELVCRQVMPLLEGTRLSNVVPAAGHLSSSSIYRHVKHHMSLSPLTMMTLFASGEYEWREWNMISENHPSEFGEAGDKHSGRIACAYQKPSTTNESNISIEVAVFECESSGGINAGKPTKPSFELICAMENREIGEHCMLTVGLGTEVYIYAQNGQDPAQQNVTLMRESETTMRRPSIRKASSLLPNIQPHSRFTSCICCRVLNLKTVDGLPPIPTALSWVQDGILIVGMQSEMRVYNQWNFKKTEVKAKQTVPSANPNIVSLTVSTSHSMLNQLTRKKEALVSSRIRVFLEFVNTMHKTHPKENKSQTVLDIRKREGVFETARICSPILPQYHPKRLIVLLNAGKKRRVKAILNHVLTSLKQRKSAAHNPLSRAVSIKRMSTVDRGSQDQATPADNTDEYDDLFDNGYDKESDIDAILTDSDSVYSGRSRHLSRGSDTVRNESHVAATFPVKDYRKLTELLTHTYLPGLSSVGKMHLLAIADTLSHLAIKRTRLVASLSEENSMPSNSQKPDVKLGDTPKLTLFVIMQLSKQQKAQPQYAVYWKEIITMIEVPISPEKSESSITPEKQLDVVNDSLARMTPIFGCFQTVATPTIGCRMNSITTVPESLAAPSKDTTSNEILLHTLLFCLQAFFTIAKINMAKALHAANERNRLRGFLQDGPDGIHEMVNRTRLRQASFDEFLQEHHLNAIHHPLPTKQEVRKWKNNMDEAIKSSVVSMLFQQTLYDRQLPKHLAFYLESGKFRKERDAQKRKVLARQIYNEFMADNRPDNIGALFSTLRHTVDTIVKNSRPSTFNLARERVAKKLKKEFALFIVSPVFIQLTTLLS